MSGFVSMLVLSYITFNAVLLLSSACHPRNTPVKGNFTTNKDVVLISRNKRQIEIHMEDFFADCLISSLKMNRSLDLITVVDFTIRQSSWFARTAGSYCEVDTVYCWTYLLLYYLRPDSVLLQPSIECIRKYADLRGTPGKVFNGVRPTPDCKKVKSALKIDDSVLSTEISSRYVSSDVKDQSFRNVITLLDFCRRDMYCSMDFCDCGDLNLPADEECGKTWYSKLAAMTSRQSSGYAAAVSGTNEVIRKASSARSMPVTTTEPDFVTLPTQPEPDDLLLQYWLQIMVLNNLMNMG